MAPAASPDCACPLEGDCRNASGRRQRLVFAVRSLGPVSHNPFLPTTARPAGRYGVKAFFSVACIDRQTYKLRIADELRARPAAEPLWEAIAGAVTARFQPGQRKVRKASDAGRWVEQIRFVITEPAIHGEVLKATAAAQEELAKAIAERTSTRVGDDLYPQLAAAVVGAGIGVAMECWLRGGPVGSVVPLLRDMLDLIKAGLPAPAEAPKRTHR